MKAVSESLAGRVGIVEMLGLSHSEVAGTPSEPYLPSADYFMRRVDMAKPFGAVSYTHLDVYKRQP